MTVNKTTSTCIAGGVQIKGMHATVAPRHHGHATPPTIEQYAFVPYKESNLLIDDEDLLKYRDVCAGYLGQTLGAVYQSAGLDVPSVAVLRVCGAKAGLKVCLNFCFVSNQYSLLGCQISLSIIDFWFFVMKHLLKDIK